ncbi:hypothetical protein D3C71_1476250 [compost metagenome]
MFKIKEMYGSIFCTDSSSGDILYELTHPAVLFMGDLFDPNMMITIVRLGNKEDVDSFYVKRVEKATAAGLESMLEEYFMADLPLDAEILDKIYNNTGFLKKFLIDSATVVDVRLE